MNGGRRAALGGLVAGWLATALPRGALAFGASGSFHPRLLSVGGARLRGARESAPGRWSWELARRTSAPSRLDVRTVAADARSLLQEPFALWVGAGAAPKLSAPERRGLERYLRLGGMLVVDDLEPQKAEFSRSAAAELARVLPEAAPVRLADTHVLYRTYYLVDRPQGRVQGPPEVRAIVRGGTAQVVLLEHDLLGALAERPGGGYALEVEGGPRAREMAIRFAVNLAMYLLCSDYKDDQVHAPWLMRRRARVRR